MFDGEWEQRSLFGWENAIAKIYGEDNAPSESNVKPHNEQVTEQAESNYCQACRKSFTNKNVYDFHLKGKRHIKAAAALQAEKERNENEIDGEANKSVPAKGDVGHPVK